MAVDFVFKNCHLFPSEFYVTLLSPCSTLSFSPQCSLILLALARQNFTVKLCLAKMTLRGEGCDRSVNGVGVVNGDGNRFGH